MLVAFSDDEEDDDSMQQLISNSPEAMADRSATGVPSSYFSFIDKEKQETFRWGKFRKEKFPSLNKITEYSLRRD